MTEEAGRPVETAWVPGDPLVRGAPTNHVRPMIQLLEDRWLASVQLSYDPRVCIDCEVFWCGMDRADCWLCGKTGARGSAVDRFVADALG